MSVAGAKTDRGNTPVVSFGEKLRQERERRGVSLEDISRSTKIGTRLLRAIEEEHFDQLPGGIFNKGFIRAYARFLKLNEDELVEEYLVKTGARQAPGKAEDQTGKKAASPEPAVFIEARAEQTEGKPASGLPWGWFAVALLLAAVGLALWNMRTQKPVSAPHSSESSSLSIQPVSTAVEERKAPKDTGSAATAASPDNPPAAPTALHSAPVNDTAAAGESKLAARGFSVGIRARQDCWVSIMVDGEVTTQNSLAAGTERTVRAENEVVIKSGSIGALDFEFNGSRLPGPGDLGEAKTLTFGPRGLEPSVAKAEPASP